MLITNGSSHARHTEQRKIVGTIPVSTRHQVTRPISPPNWVPASTWARFNVQRAFNATNGGESVELRFTTAAGSRRSPMSLPAWFVGEMFHGHGRRRSLVCETRHEAACVGHFPSPRLLPRHWSRAIIKFCRCSSTAHGRMQQRHARLPPLIRCVNGRNAIFTSRRLFAFECCYNNASGSARHITLNTNRRMSLS